MNTINPQYIQTNPPEQRSKVDKLAYLPNEPQQANLTNAKSLDELLRMSKMEAVKVTHERGNASGAVFHTSQGPVVMTVKHVHNQSGNSVSFYKRSGGTFQWASQETLTMQISKPEEAELYNEVLVQSGADYSDGLTFQGNSKAIKELLTALMPIVPKDINAVREIIRKKSIRTELSTYRLNHPNVDSTKGPSFGFVQEPQKYSLTINLDKKDVGNIRTAQKVNKFGLNYIVPGTSGSVSISREYKTNNVLFLSFAESSKIMEEDKNSFLKKGSTSAHIPLTQDMVEKALMKLESSNDYIA